MKVFTKNNEEFTCINCLNKVSKHLSTSRDHCNKCLFGLHVDINPGDRANTCKGILIPKALDIRNRKTKIVYLCQRCQRDVKNIVSNDDNIDAIIELTKSKYIY